MLERFKLLLRLEEKEGIKKSSLKHIAVTTHGMETWAENNKKEKQETYQKCFSVIKEIIESGVKANIPILTIYVLPEKLKEEEAYSIFLDELVSFLNNLKDSGIVHDNKMKVSALGKWYDIPGRAVEAIKSIIEETKDYDSFFLNFCINYDGQEEIVDAAKLIARKVKADKLDIEHISKNAIKESIYSSYFLPPNLIIKNGLRKRTSGLLLWDSQYAEIYFTEKLFPDFTKADFAKAIADYKK